MLIGPAVTRAHQTQVIESEIRHRPRRGADVFAELRFNQNHCRCAIAGTALPVVGPCHGISIAEKLASRQALYPIFQRACVRISFCYYLNNYLNKGGIEWPATVEFQGGASAARSASASRAS